VIFGDKLDRVWNQIVSFGQPTDGGSRPALAPPLFATEEELPAILAGRTVDLVPPGAGEEDD